MAKGVKTGGRAPGVPNKRTLLVEDIAARFDTDPFEILMRFACGHWKELGYDSEVYVMEGANGTTKIGYTISPEMRLKATSEAVKYLHSQKQAIKIDLNQIHKMTDQEFEEFKKKTIEEHLRNGA